MNINQQQLNANQREAVTTANDKNSVPKTSTDQIDNCYCSAARNSDKIDLQCGVCSRWYHLNCIEIEIGPVVKFMLNYHFICKKCSPNKLENFVKKQASFHQMCLTALANLTSERIATQQEQSSRTGGIYFSKDQEIIPYIERNWEALTNAPKRTKPTWHSTISRSLTREDVFMSRTENNESMYALREHIHLDRLGPFNENSKLVLGSSRLNNENRAYDSSMLSAPGNVATGCGNGSGSGNGNGNSNKRGSKRKVSESAGNSGNGSSYSGAVGSSAGLSSSRKKGGANDLSRLEKMIPVCFPSDHPYNKDGYRYHLVEPDPHSPMRQKFEETELWAGKPLPGHLYRLFLESRVALALHDRAPQLKLSEDRMCVTGEKGYSMVRASHGASRGSWYFEVTVKEKPGNSALRIGWAQPLANLQAPCGYDKFSYSWRSRKGTSFHNSVGKTYSKLADLPNGDSASTDTAAAAAAAATSSGNYNAGDVLGFYIHLPLNETTQMLADSCKHMTLVKFKNHLYYEEKDNFSSAEKKLSPLKNSKIVFFKNGKCQGVAYQDIYQGMYYPAISVYKNASAVINFGPNFKYPISDANYLDYKPISDLAIDKYVEYNLSDLVYHVEQDGKYDA